MYTTCERCGKQLNVGDEVIQHKTNIGVYCSIECFFRAFDYGRKVVLTEEKIKEDEEGWQLAKQWSEREKQGSDDNEA